MTEITIRRMTPDDAGALQRIFDGPRALRGTLQVPFWSAAMRRERFLELPKTDYPLAALVGEDVVGQLVLHTNPNSPRRRHAGSLGMAVRDDWQGRGVGTALMTACIDLADNWLNLSRLELEVFVDNEPGIRLYRKFDFVVEGTFSQFAFRDGQFVDAFAMARLRPGP